MKKAKIKLFQLQDNAVVLDAHAQEIGLCDEEFERLKRLIGRYPNKVELGIVAALWSEHCSYKSTKAHLSRLPSAKKGVLVGPGENAGAIEIDENLAVVFKIESHNHPSFIEPFHGAATGVGGILRDIFTMGARPFVVANFLRFGETTHNKTPHLFHGVVSGISHYGNCFGVANVMSNIDFHKSYNGNILVNAFAMGVVEKSQIFSGTAQGIKNRLIYVGAKTGRDGIMGAVMASDSFSSDTAAMRPTVQVGDPFCGKLLLEACLKAYKENLVVGIQDMGAAGLTSSSFEMASKASTGLVVNLDHVPLRDESMSAYEIMLSESQERMLMVAQPNSLPRLKEIFSYYELDCADIGYVTGDGIVKISYKGSEVANLSASLITENAPRYRRDYHSEIPIEVEPLKERYFLTVDGVIESFKADCAQKDQTFVTSQFDHHIGLNTIVGPNEADATLIRIPTTNKAVAISLVGNGKLSKFHPLEAAKRCIYQALLEISCQGAQPLGITNCLNFGSPQNPDVMTDVKYTIDGMAQAASALNIPVISGNVSLYNDTNGEPILPTLALALVGLSNEPAHFTKWSLAGESDLIMVLGETPDDFAGCESALSDDLVQGELRALDPDHVNRMAHIISAMVQEQFVRSSAVVSHGGFLKSLIQIMAKSNLGAVLDFHEEWMLKEITCGLSSENTTQVILVMPECHVEKLAQACSHKIPLACYGRLGGENLLIRHNGQEIYNKPHIDVTSRYLHDWGEMFANT